MNIDNFNKNKVNILNKFTKLSENPNLQKVNLFINNEMVKIEFVTTVKHGLRIVHKASEINTVVYGHSWGKNREYFNIAIKYKQGKDDDVYQYMIDTLCDIESDKIPVYIINDFPFYMIDEP